MTSPFFSIVIPAKGRPQYLDEAIQSVLLQGFDDYELIISNNGADPALACVIQKYLKNNKIKYLVQSDVLNMPSHWEKITQDFAGKYLMVVTDRSLLKKGTLYYLHQYISGQVNSPEVVTWPWDIYHDDLKVLLPHSNQEKIIKQLNSNDVLLDIAMGGNPLAFHLPRGLNCCVSKILISKIRERIGSVFRPISPDITFAYLCLLNTENITYIERSMFVSQGLKISNGGMALVGDSSHYFKALNIKEPFKHVPVKSMLFQSSIHEDFLAMSFLCSRNDLMNAWDMQKYFTDCFAEIDEKKVAGFLKTDYIQDLENNALQALAEESAALQREVKKSRTSLRLIKLKLIYTIKSILSKNANLHKIYLLTTKKNSKHFNTALEAAGFENINQ